MHSWANTARTGCSWPSFWANLVSFSPAVGGAHGRALALVEAEAHALLRRGPELNIGVVAADGAVVRHRDLGLGLDLGFSRIVVSKKEAPNMLVHMV
jgi:hypothetical protein